MTKTIHTDDMGLAYKALANYVRDGHVVSPRGKETRERLAVTVVLYDPMRALVRGTNRKLAPAVAASDALQLIGGFSDPAATLRVTENFKKYMDGGVFHAPYGSRTRSQIAPALERLCLDPDSRQAVVMIWDPAQDLWTEGSRDYPCTTQLQFMIREGKLDLHVTMRSNDLWHGFVYDIFQFCQLQLAAACSLGLEPGTYYHHAASLHLYEPELEKVDGLLMSETEPLDGIQGSAPWSKIQERARGLFYGSRHPATEGERFMYGALRRRGIEGAW